MKFSLKVLFLVIFLAATVQADDGLCGIEPPAEGEAGCGGDHESVNLYEEEEEEEDNVDEYDDEFDEGNDSPSDFIKQKVCPHPWPESQCLGSSGDVAPHRTFTEEATIEWQEGLSGHSHYMIDPKTTAVFAIDVQYVYESCPEELTLEALLKDTGTADEAGHSPLCCEKFYDSVANINKITERAREVEMPVFFIAHVYRDFDEDDEIDNCGRMCDFDLLGWAKWPKVWNLFSEKFPWSGLVVQSENSPKGVKIDYEKDFYTEKSIYSAITDVVAYKLVELGIDTIIITGFMAQYCCVTTARNGHDLGFKIIYVNDACDGPIVQELVSGIDENKAIPFYLGAAVADVMSTEELLHLV